MATGTSGLGQWFWPAVVAAAGLLMVFGFVSYMTSMPGRSWRGPLPPLSEREAAIRDEMKAHVQMLAGEIGERNLRRYAALNRAAAYIRAEFERLGYRVREQPYQVDGVEVRNLEVELPGSSRPEEIVLFGAHYDSVTGTPGANDNASGVAALLVLARLARERTFARTVRLVAFVNEEPPYFMSGQMGSQVYAREAARRGERITAMVSLETIGSYSDRPGSQAFPFAFRLGYPDTGNFIAFVSNLGSRSLVRRMVGAFREHARFPSEGIAAPTVIPGISWSDQWSFWKEGYPGVMVTDTALFRYAEYHSSLDRPEILDYERTARVVAGLAEVLADLASR